MISITLISALMIVAAAPSPAPSVQARKAYSLCLQKVIKDKTEAKLAAAAFTTEAKTACATQEAALVSALVAYNIGMGSKRADAEDDAKAQVEDSLANAGDTYTTYTTDPAPK